MVSTEHVVSVSILGFLLLLYWMTRVRKVTIYEAVVKEKMRKHAMNGVGIPSPDYVLVTDKTKRVVTTRDLFDRVNVGDTVIVSVFSNGVHRVIEYYDYYRKYEVT